MTALARTRTTAEWRAADAAHHLHPFTDYASLRREGSRIMVRGDGLYLWDSDGAQILDGMSGLWCVNVGYGRKELAQAAYDQLIELPFYNTFFKTATPPAIALAERLIGLAPPGFQNVFFANSGSEANDTILRLVRRYWQLKGRPEKQTIISREYAYHGSTVAAASLNGMVDMHRQAGLMPHVEHVMPPYWYAYGGDMDEASFGRKAAQAVADRIRKIGADKVAAFIGEPIQGAGGVIIPPASYWPEIQRICRENDVLLIADEVICGFGRTGRWFGSDTFDIAPDFMTLAKGVTSGYLPLSAVLVGDRVAALVTNEGGEFYHGFTYSGHPVAAAVALANIDILERERLVERAAEQGPKLLAALRAALNDHPLVGEIRGLGLIGAIELVQDKRRRAFFPGALGVGLRCRNHCFANNLIMRAVRDTMVFAPALIIDDAQITELVARAVRAIDLTHRELKHAA